VTQINQEINTLVQADLDGLITPEQRQRLEAHLESSEEVRAFYADCQQLVDALNDLEALEPPPGLDDSILAAARSRVVAAVDASLVQQGQQADQEGGLRSMLAIWLNFPVLRYAGAFLLGALLTTLLSDRDADRAPAQVVNLAGTMSPVPEFALVETQQIQGGGAELRLDLLKSDDLLQIRFSVESDAPIELEMRYAIDAYGLFGFSQESGALGSLTAQDGALTLQALGQKRFAVFLNRRSAGASEIEVSLRREGETIQTLMLFPASVDSR
jgi:hypothetical protein